MDTLSPWLSRKKTAFAPLPGAARFLPDGRVAEISEPPVPQAPFGRASFWYLPVGAKFAISLGVSIAWLALSTWIATTWMRDLAALAGWTLSILIVAGIALVPGFMTAFLATSLLLDRRPGRVARSSHPGISILVAAYNEEASIADTLHSIARSDYPGAFEVIVIDDGSKDATASIAESLGYPWLRVLRQPRNQGKSAALNRGLAAARHDLIVTLDADSYLYNDALQRLVERYLNDPPHTRAVAGTMLVRNSRSNWVTRAQEWDYFHGIAAIKRVQSLFHGTLVAQGAFSIYDRRTLLDAGGWLDCVGEDIVLTWAILRAGWRVGHAEDACCFTNVPDTMKQFIRQRQRWARGMMEAFRRHGSLLAVPRMSMLFVWWNLLFPWLDLSYTIFFIPGVALALFGVYWIAGPLTLALLPMALAMNWLMYRIGSDMFARQGLRVRRNPVGFVVYAFAYSAILQPACLWGYLSEMLGLRKTWGTK
jgi:biofilm PGA synthesis N-glycosyltransferase PgaC